MTSYLTTLWLDQASLFLFNKFSTSQVIYLFIAEYLVPALKQSCFAIPPQNSIVQSRQSEHFPETKRWTHCQDPIIAWDKAQALHWYMFLHAETVSSCSPYEDSTRQLLWHSNHSLLQCPPSDMHTSQADESPCGCRWVSMWSVHIRWWFLQYVCYGLSQLDHQGKKDALKATAFATLWECI